MTDSCDSGWRNYSSPLQERRVDSVSWKTPAGIVLMGGYFSPDTTELVTNSTSIPDFGVLDTR